MDAGRRAAALEGLLVAAMVVTGLTLVVVPLLGPGGLGVVGDRLSVVAELAEPDRALPAPPPEEYRGGDLVELEGPVTVTASVADPDAAQRVGLVGGQLLTAATALGVLWLLLRITRSLRDGDVFRPVNALRLQRIALLVGAGGTLAQVVTAIGRTTVLERPRVSEAVVGAAEISFLPLLAAFGIGVAAEVFRQGAALREDVEGLV